jgi:hypothetical protein
MEPVRILRLEMIVFLAVLATMLAFRMLTRQINLSGLLADTASGKSVTPERVQLLIVTAAVSVKCVVNLIWNPDGTMPGIGRWWLVLFGASAGVYAVVKWLRTFRWQ